MKTSLANEQLAFHVLETLQSAGVQDFCVCPAARNSALVSILDKNETLDCHYFYEERSAAFYALGKARKTKKPVAIVTTSGTAAGELLPAAMEAHYSGVPLILLTADRPRRYRGSGAPQAAEQVGLFGPYVSCSKDLENTELLDLSDWDRNFPLHLNVCFEDPNAKTFSFTERQNESLSLDQFLVTASHPFVVVSTLAEEEREAVLRFLIQLNCPVFLEAISRLREEPRLAHLRINQADACDFPIDGVLRIGGVPTFRLWRDLDEMQNIKTLSISRLPFKGMTAGSLITVDLNTFFNNYQFPASFIAKDFSEWKKSDLENREKLELLFQEEPKASPSFMHALSKLLPENANVYLGNSLPIREWDLAATFENKGFQMYASRGVNGIDGQLSTFFGLCDKNRDNFCILGDLTTLYDMAAPWILPQMEDIAVTVFVMNNGGGKIFHRMFASDVFQNKHDLNFKPLADMWGMDYERWDAIPAGITRCKKPRLIELVPDNASTDRFWDKMNG